MVAIMGAELVDSAQQAIAELATVAVTVQLPAGGCTADARSTEE